MKIQKNGSQPSRQGPAEWFTGTVRVDVSFQAEAPGRVAGAAVTFEPGARTVWAGCNAKANPNRKSVPATPSGSPQVKGIGTTATTSVTHIAIVEKLDGKDIDWMEKVNDEQYQA
jgi:hypothetical protein